MDALELGHPVFDADNHYYEALDAFTRHLDPELGPRCVQWCEIDGRKYHVVGGRVSRAVSNATFDPVVRPGAMHDYFRGNPDGKDPLSFLRDRGPIRPEFRDRDARIAVMDEQGLDACWLFPTLGMLYEAPLAHDPVAVQHTFRAFNRWVEEDWGFAYRDRIFAGPYLTLVDTAWACEELEWALDRGARCIVMNTNVPVTETGPRSPFDPANDPFWARVAEAGITVVVHAGDSGRSNNGWAPDEFSAAFNERWQPTIAFFRIEDAAADYLTSLVFSNLLNRFPRLRFASVENGAEFLPTVFRKVRSIHKKVPGWWSEDPVELFRRQVWINPFWEDDPQLVVEWMGADRVLFGSDWPHVEGMPSPLDYVNELKDLDADTRRRILHDNVRELNTPLA